MGLEGTLTTTPTPDSPFFFFCRPPDWLPSRCLALAGAFSSANLTHTSPVVMPPTRCLLLLSRTLIQMHLEPQTYPKVPDSTTAHARITPRTHPPSLGPTDFNLHQASQFSGQPLSPIPPWSRWSRAFPSLPSLSTFVIKVPNSVADLFFCVISLSARRHVGGQDDARAHSHTYPALRERKYLIAPVMSTTLPSASDHRILITAMADHRPTTTPPSREETHVKHALDQR